MCRVKNGLQRTLAVAQVDKDDAAHISLGLHPSRHCDAHPDVLLAKRAGIMRSFHLFSLLLSQS